MNKTIKPVYPGLSILEISKKAMPEFRCDYIKPKHQEKAILSYMDTNSFIVNIKTEGTPNDVEKMIWHIKLWNWQTLTDK